MGRRDGPRNFRSRQLGGFLHMLHGYNTSFRVNRTPNVFRYIVSQKPRPYEYLHSRTSSTRKTQFGTYYMMLGRRHVIYGSSLSHSSGRARHSHTQCDADVR